MPSPEQHRVDEIFRELSNDLPSGITNEMIAKYIEGYFFNFDRLHKLRILRAVRLCFVAKLEIRS